MKDLKVKVSSDILIWILLITVLTGDIENGYDLSSWWSINYESTIKNLIAYTTIKGKSVAKPKIYYSKNFKNS